MQGANRKPQRRAAAGEHRTGEDLSKATLVCGPRPMTICQIAAKLMGAERRRGIDPAENRAERVTQDSNGSKWQAWLLAVRCR